jgi:hypothetical protein
MKGTPFTAELSRCQVPHAFQQKLSSEKTPTLAYALPAFEAMISTWNGLQVQYPQMYDIIEAGISKLNEYRKLTELTPAYILSMRNFIAVDSLHPAHLFVSHRPGHQT